MMPLWSPTKTALVCFACALAGSGAAAQIHYSSGQNVAPVFEGWERNPDGSFNMVFGYMNRNYEESVEVPVGDNNKIEPGPPDQGQPTQFYPRRQQFVFKVHVPKDWGDKDLVWTLTSHGKTERAYGSLLPFYELGTLVYLENRRGATFLTYPEEPNQPPSIEMSGSSVLTARVGEPLTLTVSVTDDGYPRPRPKRNTPPRERNRDGVLRGFPQSPASQAVVKLDPGVRLGVTWVTYRGAPGAVQFEPMRVPVVAADSALITADHIGGRATTKVTFTQPGEYRLRAYADDGVFATPLDVNVTVIDSSTR